MKTLLFISTGVLALLPFASEAEYGCQSGFVPVYQNGSQVCVADYNLPVWSQRDSAASQPAQLWVSRWGAIAVDEKARAFGIVENRASKKIAKKDAIEDCKKHGGSKCIAQHYYANQCIVMVASSVGYEVMYGMDKAVKEREGMAKCTAAQNSDCRVYYSGCSYSERIR